MVALPHLGASTSEAEDNCAVMVVDQVREYLEHGNMQNAVNFPERADAARVAVPPRDRQRQRARTCWRASRNAMGSRKINIHNMLNKSKGEMAYTLVDVDSPVPEAAIKELCAIKGVLAVRYLPVEG